MELHRPQHPVRFVTAASLFDGHDAAINVMRRILQSQGAEVIHLGHDRAVAEIVQAAISEDVQGVAISSYQGGHVEYFTYLRELLNESGAGHISVYGGGGGVIVPAEIELLSQLGVKIFSPQDGQRMGLPQMINSMIAECDFDLTADSAPEESDRFPSTDLFSLPDGEGLARVITKIEAGVIRADEVGVPGAGPRAGRAKVIGVTGTGGSGKSSLTDELLQRFRTDYQDKLRIVVIAVDPTRRRGGGALLGDRIRMNSLRSANVFFRSMATRGSAQEIPAYLPQVIDAASTAGADLIIVETPGIGQGDSALADLVDVSLYVMTPDFGAASQLEKIDMLDFADVVAINKFERRGAEDALRDVSRQLVRNREEFGKDWQEMPVFGTSAARFNDDGVTALYREMRGRLMEIGLQPGEDLVAAVDTKTSTRLESVIPNARARYLAEVAETIRDYHSQTTATAKLAHRHQVLVEAAKELDPGLVGDPNQAVHSQGELRSPGPTDHEPSSVPQPGDMSESIGREVTNSNAVSVTAELGERARLVESEIPVADQALLRDWPELAQSLSGRELTAKRGGQEVSIPLTRETLAGTHVPKIALPRFSDHGDLLRWLRAENLPGRFPFTAGVFDFKRSGEDPARMFAGEGDPFRTNRRFHLLAEGGGATRLSTAFDSVTLYGRDPDTRPDIYGKVGTSGVNIATLDDMKVLYSGFDLVDPTTSVSMTINGPAPAILAMYLNTVIDQQVDKLSEHERDPSEGELAELRANALATVRGTVQADILKEDQGQNTCLFSTEFSLRCMADIQEWFIDHQVGNFYSVSISGYHIAEAGANPISQLAFTLANAFTYVEAYLARGMDIDDFAPNLSFFFSNGMDAEYNVLGRVARRIWSIAMRDKYGANERSQKLKYHVQTSGRSLHAQEMSFNDIRTTLQALIALADNCNSLHTNAFDEAVTTPTPESVRRALAIQMVINHEWGLSMNENPLQGSFIIEELTDLVETAVLAEFDAISDRGGVLGAMETGYQRGRIQDESLLYEHRKHDGSLPIVGVNMFRAPEGSEAAMEVELMRATADEKESQLARLTSFQEEHRLESAEALQRLRDVATAGENTFEVLMSAVRVCSLGEITEAFFEVGGQYRRNV